MKNAHSKFLSLSFFSLLSLLSLFSLLSHSIEAQDAISMMSISKGFSMGAHGAYTSHKNDVHHDFPEYGPGYGIRIQYGITHRIGVGVAYQHYSMKPKEENSIVDPYQLFEYDLFGQYTFGTSTSRLRPYLQAGFNITTTSEGFHYEEFFGLTDVNTTEEYYGLTVMGGAGLSYFITPQLSADLRLVTHTGQFTKIDVTTQYTTTETLETKSDVFDLNGQLGVQYHF